MTQRERSQQARRKWQKLISAQGRSGQSLTAFCRERKLCAPHFFWGKRRLGARGAATFLEVKLAERVQAARAAQQGKRAHDRYLQNLRLQLELERYKNGNFPSPNA